MATNPRSTQDKTLDRAFHVQRKTIEALKNINEELQDSEEGGNLSLEELKRQNYKLNDIVDETDRLQHAQKESSRLHKRLGRWTLKVGGRSRDSHMVPPKKSAPPKGGSAKRRGDSFPTDSPSSPFKQSTISRTTNHSEHAANVDGDKDSILAGISILRETHASEVKELDENDREIEGLLDSASTTLSHLAALQNNISNEIHSSRDTMNVIESNLDTAGYKQRRMNARALDFMEGNYRKRAMNAGTSRK